MSKPLPKSLHTITAMQRVARHLQAVSAGRLANRIALDDALVVLGYETANDPARLFDKALKLMDAEDAKRVAVKAVA